jgi:hypothetical protein
MSALRPTYPGSLLNAVKKGPRAAGQPPLLRDLSNAILDLLQNDQQVRDLIKQKTKGDPDLGDLNNALDDPEVQDMIIGKTWPTYYGLVKKS